MYVVAWNKYQCEALVVALLDEYIKNSLDAFYEDSPAGFVLLGLFPTEQQARECCETLQEFRNQRLDASQKLDAQHIDYSNT